ncbi:hypothetical protein [Nocardia concava]|uniref:hypothetical protein n=1 Tax=Nocardia concava TaxID=257281 RepID=UPI000687D967|nr:hypothetical protein [Nocardia concava]
MARTYQEKTIKLLFGGARKCAFPGCNTALIFEDRGAFSVIAEIAHIRSEKPNGPRFDPTFPLDAINLPENLLLLCGIHHKPVDEHASRYPVEELLLWKARQISDGTKRDLSDGQVAQIFQHYELTALGPEGFQKTCQALAVHTLGPKTDVSKRMWSRPGGFDATLDGRAIGYPSSAAPWDGFIVLEALYFIRTDEVRRTLPMLRQRIDDRFDRWRDEEKYRHPDYVIFATNLSLVPTSNQHGGPLDEFHHRLGMSSERFGLKDIVIWDEAAIADLLETYAEVRLVVSTLTASNELLNSVLGQVITRTP